MDGKEAVRAHTLATSIFRHLASLQNEIPPLRAPQQSASVQVWVALAGVAAVAATSNRELLVISLGGGESGFGLGRLVADCVVCRI